MTMQPPITRRYLPLHRHSWLLLTITILLTSSLQAATSPYELADNIQRQVEQFIDGYAFITPYPVTARVNKIDKRLRLSRCPEDIDIQFANNDVKPGRTFLVVSCSNAKKPWKIYVSAQLDMFTEVLVINQSLARGHVLQPGDVRRETRNLATLRNGYLTHKEQLVDMQLTRGVTKGQVLTEPLLKQRLMVSRGQQVILVAYIGNSSVRMKGKALADGAINSLVQVKNSSSGRIIEGHVISDGVVQVSL